MMRMLKYKNNKVSGECVCFMGINVNVVLKLKHCVNWGQHRLKGEQATEMQDAPMAQGKSEKAFDGIGNIKGMVDGNHTWS